MKLGKVQCTQCGDWIKIAKDVQALVQCRHCNGFIMIPKDKT